MSSSALVSQGMTIAMGDAASPEVWSTISEVTSIGGPDGSASEIDTTDLNSTAKEFRLGLLDNGSVSISLNFIPANVQHALLRTLSISGAISNFRMTFTDSPQTTWTFTAFVMGLPIENSVDAVTTASITLRISGSITEA